MKRVILCLFVLSLLFLCSCGHDDESYYAAIEEAKEAAYFEGYKDGYEEGKQDGYAQAINEFEEKYFTSQS